MRYTKFILLQVIFFKSILNHCFSSNLLLLLICILTVNTRMRVV